MLVAYLQIVVTLVVAGIVQYQAWKLRSDKEKGILPPPAEANKESEGNGKGMPSSKPNMDKINELPMMGGKGSPYDKTLTPMTQPGTPGMTTPTLMKTGALFKT